MCTNIIDQLGSFLRTVWQADHRNSTLSGDKYLTDSLDRRSGLSLFSVKFFHEKFDFMLLLLISLSRFFPHLEAFLARPFPAENEAFWLTIEAREKCSTGI
jgi:hypothetical protein